MITTIFDLNGTFSDGGVARPVISRSGDVLTVDMSSQGRPNANGAVLSSNSIVVSFPDDTTYYATLARPGTIRWTNGSAWSKTARVPDVRGQDQDTATAILNNAGFVRGAVSTFVDRSCNYIDRVIRQSPGGNAMAIPGSSVSVAIGVRPSTDCP